MKNPATIQLKAGKTTIETKRAKDSVPLFCDFTCPHAEFTQPETSGACRRDLAVYCKKYKKHNNKNSGCIGTKK